MREFNIRYTNEGPNKIYHIDGAVSVCELQGLQEKIKANEENICSSGRGLYHFRVLVFSGDPAMILSPSSEYTDGGSFILIMTKYDPNC